MRDPSALIGSRYKTVALVLNDGTEVRGSIKSEDAFSIQIMNTEQQLRAYRLSQVRELVRETQSLMPVYDAGALSEEDLHNILGYLVNVATAN